MQKISFLLMFSVILLLGCNSVADENLINSYEKTEVTMIKKSRFEFFKWRFTRTEPERVAIDISDEWKNFDFFKWICLLNMDWSLYIPCE